MKKKRFSVLNWNIGGAKYLGLPRDVEAGESVGRDKFRKNLNTELQNLIDRHQPDVVALQEIVRYGSSQGRAQDVVDPPAGYIYCPFPLIDTERLSAQRKWNEVKRQKRWPRSTYFAQGSAFLFREELPHHPVLALPTLGAPPSRRGGNFIEQVSLNSGLYFGSRNTEPRAALIAHFVVDAGKGDKPLDIFVVNVHLTTLGMEREGIPGIDVEASSIRKEQLGTIFHRIISPYNSWGRDRYSERGRPRPRRKNETTRRHHPIWILAGDFNFTEESDEHREMVRMNFVDLHPGKGKGTKASGLGADPTMTVDYIFAGPKFIALDPVIIEDDIRGNHPADTSVRVSDHYPLFAEIPLTTLD